MKENRCHFCPCTQNRLRIDQDFMLFSEYLMAPTNNL